MSAPLRTGSHDDRRYGHFQELLKEIFLRELNAPLFDRVLPQQELRDRQIADICIELHAAFPIAALEHRKRRVVLLDYQIHAVAFGAKDTEIHGSPCSHCDPPPLTAAYLYVTVKRCGNSFNTRKCISLLNRKMPK